jgi:preprotein translocase subunit SecF
METADQIINEIEKEEKKLGKSLLGFYNKNYKLLLLIPLILLVFSLGYIGYFYSQNQDFIKRDVSLTGGTTITIFTEQKEVNIGDLTDTLSQEISDFNIRELSDFRSGKQKAIVIETSLQSSEISELKLLIETFLDYELTTENSSIESTGSALGQSFYRQLQFAILISFILMAIVVFIIFRTLAPSLAVVLSAFADIMMTLAFVNLLGMRVSSAGIIAFLMLIGYSVDTDIMLTTRLLKRHGSINEKLKDAFKTGLTMTITSIIALSVALIITQSFSPVLKQIFSILLIGLGFDILNTWITNASILKWYLERKGRD